MRDLSSLTFDRTGRRRPDRPTVRLHCPKAQQTLLTKMLTPAPYKVPEKTKKAKGTRKSSRRQASLDSSSGNSATHSSPEDEEGEEDAPPSVGGDKKRKAAPTGEAEGSKKGKTLPLDYSTNADDAKRSGRTGPSP